MLDQRLVARVESLEPASLEATAFRHLAERRHPLSASGARVHGGRWNPPDSFATLYLALERETAIAEFYRLAARQRRDPEDFLPRRLYRYDVALEAVLDLRGAAARATIALDDAELRAADATACRRVGEAAEHLGLEGLLAPSATGAGTVLAVFFDRLHADSRVHEVEYELWSAVPA